MIRFIAVAFALAPGDVARAASSGGWHDHASARSMWCWYAHGAGMHMVNGACITTSARRQVRRGVVTGH